MDSQSMHAALEPIAFLLGRWEGAGVGGYPTIESFRFGQEITFEHNGKPFLSYQSRTWLLDDEGAMVRPLAVEIGLLAGAARAPARDRAGSPDRHRRDLPR